MPYIDPKSRARLDEYIDKLADAIQFESQLGHNPGDGATKFAGLLNYTCTRLALRLIPARRYWAIALVTGVFKNIADEFYRRFGVPYEDEQIQKNGDVYT